MASFMGSLFPTALLCSENCYPLTDQPSKSCQRKVTQQSVYDTVCECVYQLTEASACVVAGALGGCPEWPATDVTYTRTDVIRR